MENDQKAPRRAPRAGEDWPLAARRLLTRGEVSADGRAVFGTGDPRWEGFYRDRWAHDKVVRSTHGVNCTGSCSWMVYVKDGIITWEQQATDYPSIGADCPEYEPRGCPRGASFSWYTYSPSRVRYPYVRGTLLKLWREARRRLGDPVAAWAEITGDPAKARAYKRARGKGGLVRAEWDEVSELVAAAHVHTIKAYGPDRVAGFSPIPAMSMASFAAGARFMSLIGGTLLSFYDWYADLPVASPQVFGDQTDVPEAADWWNAGYLIMWGSNIPVTRTPDAHFLTETRYNGTKVVALSPDYADNVKHADEWMSPHPGTDGALAMAMGHVILREFLVDREVPYFQDYLRKFTDAPFLVALRENDHGLVPDGLLTAAALGRDTEHAESKTVLLDAATGQPVVPNGSLGFRWGGSRAGPLEPRSGQHRAGVEPAGERGGDGGRGPAPLRRGRHGGRLGHGARGAGAAHRRAPGHHSLRSDAGAVRRSAAGSAGQLADVVRGRGRAVHPGLAGDDHLGPGRAGRADRAGVRPQRRADRRPVDDRPRGGHQPLVPLGHHLPRVPGAAHHDRLPGRQRRRLGALRRPGEDPPGHRAPAPRLRLRLAAPHTAHGGHLVLVPELRPVALRGVRSGGAGLPARCGAVRGQGLRGLSGAGDTSGLDARPPRVQPQPARPDGRGEGGGPAGRRAHRRRTEVGAAEVRRRGSRRPGELPSCPDRVAGVPARFLGQGQRVLPAAPAGHGRGGPLRGDPSRGASEGRGVAGGGARGQARPAGRRGLPDDLDRSALRRGPAGRDLVREGRPVSTDMHPFVHAFTPAIAPPWQARTDYDTFLTLADRFSELAAEHLGTRTDVLAVPLLHDTPDELAQPGGVVRDWRTGECEPVPGKNMPKLVVIERDYGATAQKMRAVGPLLDTLGTTTKGVTVHPDQELDELRRRCGTVRDGIAAGRPSLATANDMCEAILALSGTTNGRLATEGFRELERQTGSEGLVELASEREAERITFADTRTQPRTVMTSYEWSGSETGGRRYSPFVINTEHLKPWHTLTGRQHFFVQPDWMTELGEQLPVYRPPLNTPRHYGDEHLHEDGRAEVTVRYLTPHSKWSIHSNYQDNKYMLDLSRGGPTIWMSTVDAEKIGVKDNEWIEAYNRNGVVAARAVVTHRMPEGTVYMYHAQDRNVNVPRTEVSGRRGGIHNSLTRLLLKPTHLAGGYAQFTYAFNYYGPTGNQRDEVTVIRRSQQVEY